MASLTRSTAASASNERGWLRAFCNTVIDAPIMKPNSKRRLAIAFVALVTGAAAPGVALAEDCPSKPDDAVCRPWSAILLPTVYGAVYAPNHGTAYAGGGVEAVLLAWSDNSPAFG